MNKAVEILLAAILASACRGVATTGTPPPSESASPSASSVAATPTPLPSPTPEPSDGPVSLPFERVADVHGTAELYAITAFEGGFVAGGCRLRAPSSDSSEGGCAIAHTLISQDGRSWRELPLPDASDIGMIVGLSATPLGVLAFGTTLHPEPPQARAVWRLTSDHRWEAFAIPAPSAIVFRTAAAVNGRTVFLGSDTTYDLTVESVAWSTVNGAAWSNGSTPISAKVVAEPGLVALGNECVDVCEERGTQTRVFRSADGITWTDEQFPSDLASTTLEALAVWDGRAIIGGGVATSGQIRATVWLDEDTGWRHVVLPEGAGMKVSNVLVSAQGIIAIGWSETDRPPAAWWSTDGVAWNPGRLEGIGQGYIAASAGGTSLVVIVNYDSIWVSAF